MILTATFLNTRADIMIYPKHRLSLTEGSSIYVIIKFYNNLPQQVKSQIKHKAFKQNLFQYLVSLEPYTISEYLQTN